MRKIVSTAILVFLAGCAPTTNFPDVGKGLAEAEARKQRAAVVEARIRDSKRLQSIAFNIASKNVELCGDKIASKAGFSLSTLDNLEDPWKDAWRSQFGIGERPTIVYVSKNSPAERAGIRSGDRIVRVGDTDVGIGKRALAAVRASMNADPVEFVIERTGAKRTVTIAPVAQCDYPVQLVQDDRVNAFADGKSVKITTGMLRFAQTDEELALIVGHELAHNTRGHIEAKQGNMVLGGLLGTAASVLIGVNVADAGLRAGAGAFSQEFEAEADYVGVYHAARAGYDVAKAASFWRRMAVAHPQGIHLAGSSHPSTAKRFLLVETATREIERKRSSNLPLVPEERAKR